MEGDIYLGIVEVGNTVCPYFQEYLHGLAIKDFALQQQLIIIKLENQD